MHSSKLVKLLTSRNHLKTAYLLFQRSHIPATSNHDRLARDIREQRASHRQDGRGSLRRLARPPERDIGMLLLGRDLLCSLGDADSDALALGADDKGALLLGLRETSLDVSEGERVGADAEARPPLLRDGLGHARDAGLGHGVVDLPRVAVDAARRADVDDAARLAVLDAEAVITLESIISSSSKNYSGGSGACGSSGSGKFPSRQFKALRHAKGGNKRLHGD